MRWQSQVFCSCLQCVQTCTRLPDSPEVRRKRANPMSVTPGYWAVRYTHVCEVRGGCGRMQRPDKPHLAPGRPGNSQSSVAARWRSAVLVCPSVPVCLEQAAAGETKCGLQAQRDGVTQQSARGEGRTHRDIGRRAEVTRHCRQHWSAAPAQCYRSREITSEF